MRAFKPFATPKVVLCVKDRIAMLKQSGSNPFLLTASGVKKTPPMLIGQSKTKESTKCMNLTMQKTEVVWMLRVDLQKCSMPWRF